MTYLVYTRCTLITHRAVPLQLQNLRGHELAASANVIHKAVLHAAGHAEVCDPDAQVVVGRGQQQVCRLEVSVHDVLSVHVLDAAQEDAAKVSCFLLIVCGLFIYE